MKQWLLNCLLKKIYKPIVTSDIIVVDKGTLKIDGKVITEQELRQLKAEEKALSNSRLWDLMIKTTRHLAEKQIITDSINMSHVTMGKSMIISLDTIESIGRVIKNK